MKKKNTSRISVTLALLLTFAAVSFGESFEPTVNAGAQLTVADKLKLWKAEEDKKLPRTVNGTEFMFTTIVCPAGCDYKVKLESSRLSIRGKTPGINGQASINKAESHKPALRDLYCSSKGVKYKLPMSIYINNGANTTFHEIKFEPSDCPTKTPSTASGSAEQAYWDLVKDSTKVSDFRSYLAAYPTGAHVPHATLKISQLSGSTSTTPVPTPTPTTNNAAEQAYWDLVKDSKKVSDFRSYLAAYPSGAYVAHANLKISQLSSSTTPTPPPSSPTSSAAEQGYWDLVKNSTKVSDFRSYLAA